ncbi:MAG: hypothetical protein R2795_12645 [Saprospiraceae bacterium]
MGVPLLLFMGASPLNALEYSRRLINRRWGSLFMLLLTFFSLFIVGSTLLSPLAAMSAGVANVASFLLFLAYPLGAL